jgi:hypothetical protein
MPQSGERKDSILKKLQFKKFVLFTILCRCLERIAAYAAMTEVFGF